MFSKRKPKKIKIPVDLELANFLAALIVRLAPSDRSFLLFFDLVRQASRQPAFTWLDRAAKVRNIRFARLRRINVAVATAIENKNRPYQRVTAQILGNAARGSFS